MAERQPHLVQPADAFSVQAESPLIGVFVDNEGQETVTYFVSDEVADQPLQQEQTQDPIKLAGVWSDLDADAMLDGLDRLRHESNPTPPVTSF
jgi:hypothetical protein